MGSRIALNWGPAEAGPRMGDGRKGSARARRGGGAVTKGPIRAVHPGHQGDGGWQAPGPSPALCHERPADGPCAHLPVGGTKGLLGTRGDHASRLLRLRRPLEAGAPCGAELGVRAPPSSPSLPSELAAPSGVRPGSAGPARRERAGGGAAHPHPASCPGDAPGSGRRVRRLEG